MSGDERGRLWLEQVPLGLAADAGDEPYRTELLGWRGDYSLLPAEPGHGPVAFLGDDGGGRARYLHTGRADLRAAVPGLQPRMDYGWMESVVSEDGTRIAVERVGEGPPLVYVGGPLNTRDSGEALAELLAPEFSVLTYDRRGRGDSGDTAPYAVEREIEDLAAVIAVAGGAAAVHGFSCGGALALEAAAHGVAITALTLFEVPYSVVADEGGARRYAAELDRLLADGRREDAVALFMTRAAMGVLTGMLAELVDAMRGDRDPMWLEMEAMAPTLAYDSAVMGYRDRGGALPIERLVTVTAPALVMDGRASAPPLRQMARRLAEVLPGGRYRTPERKAHDSTPEVLAPVIGEFLRNVRW